MRNAHITDLLSDYIDGALQPADRERVKSHLVFCNSCRSDFEEIERNVDLLRSSVALAPPPGLDERIIAAMARTPEAPATEGFALSWPSRLISLRGAALAATCAIAGLVVWRMPDGTAVNLVSSGGSAAPREGRVELETSDRPLAEEEAIPVSAKPPGETHELDRGESAGRSADASAAVRLPAAVNAVQAAKPAAQPVAYAASDADRSRSRLNRNAADENPLLTRASGIMQPPLSMGAAGLAASKPVEAPAADGSNLEVRGTTSGLTKPLEAVVSSQKEWSRLWSRHAKAFNTPPTAPAVDFDRHELLAIFAGDHPTGGAVIELTGIKETEWEGKPARVVNYSIRQPAEGAFKIMVVTQPFLLKAVPRFEGRTFFRKSP